MASEFLTTNYFPICRLHVMLRDWLPCVTVIMVIAISEADAPSGFFYSVRCDTPLPSRLDPAELSAAMCAVLEAKHCGSWQPSQELGAEFEASQECPQKKERDFGSEEREKGGGRREGDKNYERKKGNEKKGRKKGRKEGKGGR